MSYLGEEREKDSLDSDSLESEGEEDFESIEPSDVSKNRFAQTYKTSKYTEKIERTPKMKQTSSYKEESLHKKRKKKSFKNPSKENLSDNEEFYMSEEDPKEKSKSTHSKPKSNPNKRGKHGKAKTRKTKTKGIVEDEKQQEIDAISEMENRDQYKTKIKTSMDKIKALLKSQTKLPASNSSLKGIKTLMNYLLKESSEIVSQLPQDYDDSSSLNQEDHSSQASIKVAQIKSFVQKWEKENSSSSIQNGIQEPEKENRFEQVEVLIERLKWSTLMYFKALSSEKEIDISSVNETLQSNSETFKLILKNLKSICENFETSTQQSSQGSIDLKPKLLEIIDELQKSRDSTESCYHKSARLITEIDDISEVDSESDFDESDDEEILKSSQGCVNYNNDSENFLSVIEETKRELNELIQEI